MKKRIISLLIMILVTILISIFLYLKYDNSILVFILGLLLIIFLLFNFFFEEKFNYVLDKIINYRYLIALFVFIICVFFKVHGSSIGVYNYLFSSFEEYNKESIILGKTRSIRGDEYNVHTPYYISQYYNDFKKESNMMSLSGQDMIIGYNAPVKDLTLIGKPFTWGYIFLGNEYGLSWYWCSKIILLILVSFELCMIITKKDKKISILGSLLLAFSPCMQWWFVPHMCDVFFWGMTLLVVAYHFFTTKNKLLKNIFTIVLPCSISTFVIALFPSLQISVGLVSIVLLITFLIRDKKDITFNKKDIIRIIIMFIIVSIILGQFFYTSLDGIKALFNTVYPGKRISLGGGDSFKSIFTDLTTFMLPYKDITYLNNCEVSTFIHFAPIFILLYSLIRKKLKEDNNIIVGKSLLICIVISLWFMLIGFPELLAKITLFSYINRMNIAYGYMAVLFTVWGISTIWNNKDILSKKSILLVLLIYGISYVMCISKNELSYMPWFYYAFVIICLSILVYLLLTKKRKLFLYLTFLLILLSSFTINPIARGMKSVFSHPLEKEIRKISNKDSNAYWLAINNKSMTTSIGIMNGARVINKCNFYPDYEKWKIIDPKGKSSDLYNRYAHIITDLTNDKTKISKINEDAIYLELNYNDLLKLPVKYVLSDYKLDSNFNYNNISFKLLYTDSEGEYYIYEVIK